MPLPNIVQYCQTWPTCLGQVRGDPAGDEGRHGQGVPQVHGVPEPAEHQPAASGQRPDQRQVRQAEAAGGGEGQARQGEGGLRGVEEEVLTLSDNQQSQDNNEVDFTLVQNNKINPISILIVLCVCLM